ncbi:WXG100 family type VII secretion target [Nocardia camponoti]|uniref:ESAT-6-like protein n=1 Tax=Nocardia camponoti TaxID=1616106 RepID=A0A917QMP5_9NOCA|nr:WXG100 family type VII secretion target [Nocardia camponoti]GGK57212.1 hypothetical protein GCM10011591_31660 [Nocardia camponoti]
MDVKKVSAAAPASAQLIADKAKAIKADLEDFKQDFDSFFNSQDGNTKEAAAARQAQWQTTQNELTMLAERAGVLAKQCHEDFQATDRSLSAQF